MLSRCEECGRLDWEPLPTIPPELVGDALAVLVEWPEAIALSWVCRGCGMLGLAVLGPVSGPATNVGWTGGQGAGAAPARKGRQARHGRRPAPAPRRPVARSSPL